MQLAWKVDEGSKVKLKKYDPDAVEKHLDRTLIAAEMETLSEELGELQQLLAAAQHHSLLIVLQGMDTSGKDGTIRHVMAHVNPLGCEVRSFKGPTSRERTHDFLWRVHRVTPGKGVISIFNRSHYEDVLAVRVHSMVSQEVWSGRYAAINDFERLLTQNDTILLKFFLHMSNDEQERRLLAQQNNHLDAWKLSSADWAERNYWDAYQEAYQDVLSQCSTEQAPWYIVPANHKWTRNVLIARTLVSTLRPYKQEWEAQLVERGERELSLLAQLGHLGQHANPKKK